MQKTKQKTFIEHGEHVSRAMALAVGATVLSLAASFSTHHITAAAHGPISPSELSHVFEREREVLHAHAQLGRSRFATVSGSAE